MNWRFTKYGTINALFSLIPIFPVWTLFPGILIEVGLENCIGDCILSYKIIMLVSIFLIICTTSLYLLRIDKIAFKEPKIIKRNFRLFSLLIYTLANTIALIIILGPSLACNGSSMSILACLYSAPIASVAIIIFGFLIDLKIEIFPIALINE